MGPNIQTLSAIERGIRSFERSLATKPSKIPKSSDEPIHTLLNRPRLLITLLGNLERLFFNAYDGCAIALPPATKIVRTFFINNRKICEQWLKGKSQKSAYRSYQINPHDIETKYPFLELQ